MYFFFYQINALIYMQDVLGISYCKANCAVFPVGLLLAAMRLYQERFTVWCRTKVSPCTIISIRFVKAQRFYLPLFYRATLVFQQFFNVLFTKLKYAISIRLPISMQRNSQKTKE